MSDANKAALTILYQEHALDDVMAFWAKQYNAPIEHYEWFIDQRKQQAIFKLYVRAGDVRREPERGICAHEFDHMICVAPAGHDGPHVASNERFPRGLAHDW